LAFADCCKFTTSVLKTSSPLSSVTHIARFLISFGGLLRPISAAIARGNHLCFIEGARSRFVIGDCSPFVKWKKKRGMTGTSAF
jgi:hypothetical protein